jgi:MoaA/NifB/PqqE/SkfB family radical SAM enzyme
MLGNDLVVNEDSCNLSCSYCLTGQSNLKKGHEEQLIFKPPVVDRYTPETSLGRRLDVIGDRVQRALRVPLLKVTGGEIFLVRGMIDYLAREAPKYRVLVIQTNGLLVTEEHLERFRSWGNVVVQVSLDSHLHPGNSYRVPQAGLHGKVIERIERILDSGLPVEVYAVLNDRSVEELEPFAAWLAARSRPPVCFPFPVRGPSAQEFAVRPDQVPLIERFVARYDDFAAVLPPRPYFARLLSFYHEGRRTFRCHLPRLVVSTFSDGMITPCPNIWFSDMGSVLDEAGWERSLDRIGGTGLYQALLAPTPRLAACKGCYTPWDLLSMYFDDEITLDELCAAPTYAPDEIRELLRDQKERYRLEAAAREEVTRT